MGRIDSKPGRDVLLKGGLIVDGTGARAFKGNVLIKGGRIQKISHRSIRTEGLVIDCAGKVISPGFIDAHSHMDWRLPIKGHDELKRPFTSQGITTFIAGNCGASAAGFRPETSFKSRIEENPRNCRLLDLDWDTMAEYFSRLSRIGLSHNLAMLVGHGSVRTSIRGFDPSPLHPYESSEMTRLLERAMEEGARGISLGLRHEPGIFARPEEIAEAALAARRRNVILAVHIRALSTFSGSYPNGPLSRPHNLMALEEALSLAQKTGVRLQISHLRFEGSRTWKTMDAALRMIESSISHGADVGFDISPYHCGAWHINTLLPPWFLARLPGAFDDAKAMRRLRRGLSPMERSIGSPAMDIKIADAVEPGYKKHDGQDLSEIARARRVRAEEALIDIARASKGRAAILCHRCSNDEILHALMRHPACLFATNAVVESDGAQNPSAFGAFPRFLKLARERRTISLEETVRKMTGAVAERFGIKDRGILSEGMAADVVVFDWETIEDNNNDESAGKPPSGIERVFVNGRLVLGGEKKAALNAGAPLPWV
jgi:N-acyl-D-amino-acid deacylase